MKNQQQSHQQSNSTNVNTSRVSTEDLVACQNLLFSLMSVCLDSLFNYMPNFADTNYLSSIDEYKLLLAFQLAPPSSFDMQSPLSFGSILWIIDYILKLLHRVST